METQQLSEEIDHLVDEGCTFYDEYEIGIESFHHLRSIRQQVITLQRLALILITVTLLLGCVLIIIVLSSNSEPDLAVRQPSSSSSAAVDTIEKLKTENILLKEKNSALSNELKFLRNQLLKRNDADHSERQPAPLPTQSEGIIYHEVKRGETLFSIAKKYYGDGKMADKIIRDNALRGASDIYEGKQLKIIFQKKNN
ncbi:MAG TPA: LysM peptidoglycan-binding domain-containing protein [Chitinophagales bacterium]|nr:LysM peptidoglycan-binding domain-containing protein [Chitinophagales bacterium]